MRHAPRHLLPGGDFLRLQQFGEVLEHQDHAEVLVRFILHPRTVQRDRQEFALHFDGAVQRQVVALILEHAVVDRLEEGQAGLLEDVVHRPTLHAIRGKPENPLAGRIKIRHDTALVDRQQAGGDGVDDRLNIGTAAVELKIVLTQGHVGRFDLRLTALQVGRHAIERIDERADFVGRLRVDAHGKVALGDRFRRLSQSLNRHRNAARNVEPEPRGSEHDQQGDDGHKKVGPRLDRVLHRLDLLILLVLTPDPVHLGEQGLGHIGIDHDDAADFVASSACGHRSRSAHEPAGLRLLNRIRFLFAVDGLEHQLADR